MNNTDIVVAVVVSTLLILLLIAGIVISFFIAGRQRTRQQVEMAQARLVYEKELRKVEIEVSEGLHQQFAQELHDNIGHSLTCIRLELENRKLDNPDLGLIFKPMDFYLNEATQELRLLSRSLNTEYVSDIGLMNAIQLEVDRQLQLKKFQVHWTQQYESQTIDRNQELMVFRIFQEIVHNAMKHSKAKNLHVRLISDPLFELTVRDDGKGFGIDETLKSPSASGLKNILRRAQLAGISCHIDSTPGAGSIYTLRKKIENPALQLS